MVTKSSAKATEKEIRDSRKECERKDHERHYEDNADTFLKKVHQHTDIQELDAEIILTFVNRINVYAAEIVNGKRQQHIQIIYNCIGELQTPKHEKTA